MTGEVIKSYLVGLGFGVDDASLTNFNRAVASAGLKVAALYAGTKIAAAGIVAGIAKISQGFEDMGYEYRLIIPQINKAIALRRELLKAYSAAGINIQRVVVSAVKLNFSLAKTKFAFEAIYKSVASKFFPLLTKQSDAFRAKLYANLPKIQAGLEKFVNFVFKAFEATTELGYRVWSILGRVYDFFVKLNAATDGWSTIILGVIAAWKLLNLSFLATPLGLVLTGLLAILALYDDFKVFEEGGKSFFNWTPFIPVINNVAAALKSVWAVLEGIAKSVYFVITGLLKLISLDFTGFWAEFGKSGDAILTTIQRLWDLVKNIGGSIGALTQWVSGLSVFSGQPGIPSVSPVGSGTTNNSASTNQNVQQQTTINISGSADAQATARSVGAAQTNVNFDLVRNLKGATR